MNKVYKKHSNNFILYEIFMLSWSAAVGRSKTYTDNINDAIKVEIKNEVKRILYNMWDDYKIKVDEDSHIKNIEFISDKVSNKFHNYLVNRRFRIGSSQKVLNLFLKYLWCLDKIVEPPHCPIDSIILEKLNIEGRKKNLIKKKVFSVSWTKLDSIKDYLSIIKEAKKITGISLSIWELKNFERHTK